MGNGWRQCCRFLRLSKRAVGVIWWFVPNIMMKDYWQFEFLSASSSHTISLSILGLCYFQTREILPSRYLRRVCERRPGAGGRRIVDASGNRELGCPLAKSEVMVERTTTWRRPWSRAMILAKIRFSSKVRKKNFLSNFLPQRAWRIRFGCEKSRWRREDGERWR